MFHFIESTFPYFHTLIIFFYLILLTDDNYSVKSSTFLKTCFASFLIGNGLLLLNLSFSIMHALDLFSLLRNKDLLDFDQMLKTARQHTFPIIGSNPLSMLFSVSWSGNFMNIVSEGAAEAFYKRGCSYKFLDLQNCAKFLRAFPYDCPWSL